MFKPIAIAELDLANSPGSMVFNQGFDSCRILLKYNQQPVEWVQVPLIDGEISKSQLELEVIKQKGLDVLHRIMQQKTTFASALQYLGITVVVCTRNRANFLSDCLVHLLEVDYPDYEIIVVDNAPADEQARMLTKDMPVRYVREDRPGLNNARNKGIEQARYPLVAFTDDDVRVDKNWLRSIAKNFENPSVMAVTGFVAPASLATEAEQMFELKYGGMGHGFSRRYFCRNNLTPVQLLWASGMGVGANMAFRKEVFGIVGQFDPALDVGTPTHGGGDIEMFFRVVNHYHLLVYDPGVMVWHRHRDNLPALYRQVEDNGRGLGSFLLSVLRKKQVKWSTCFYFIVVEWFCKWILRNLVKGAIPAKLVWGEVWGFLRSIDSYIQSKKQLKRETNLWQVKAAPAH
jgi:glycosyltransferase involved in cell wall biosynthesis